MAKILVTGATGFIGKRLVFYLLEQGHEVYALARIQGVQIVPKETPGFFEISCDLRDVSKVEPWPEDLEAAFYLVHSMGDVVKDLQEVEERTARNFLRFLEKTKCRQIVYLGGIIENPKELSPHLQSRLFVEKILGSGRIPLTVLRASLIIGAGSASFEIIRDLVEKLPIMVAPKWVKTLCQPIFIRDVLFYLHGVLLNDRTFGKVFDIGGPEVLSFKEVLLRYAAFRKLKRVILEVPVLTPRLSSYWLVFITSVRFSICFYLVESMKHNSRKLNIGIDAILPHKCASYEEALKTAFEKIAQNAVISTWMDAWSIEKVNPSIQEFIEVPTEGCLTDIRNVAISVPIESVKKRIWSLGGSTGWYSMDWAWRLRGLMDKLIGGAGMNRGRRHPIELQVGDSVDFWRVLLADYERGHLILFAEMKLPGEAWLEFKIEKDRLIQTATFRPKGVLGRLYWYSLIPFHMIIFHKMAKFIAQKQI